jgi:hypothetical protein
MRAVTSFFSEPSLSFLPVHICMDALAVLPYEPGFLPSFGEGTLPLPADRRALLVSLLAICLLLVLTHAGRT